MSAANPAGVAAMLRRTADAIEAGEVVVPVVSMQFMIHGLDEQDAALTAIAALFPGTAWEARTVQHHVLSTSAHIEGRIPGKGAVTISAIAGELRTATVAALAGEAVAA
jgi:hypothetical protein